MADFCLDCWNQMQQSNDLPQDYILSRRLELCENCGKMCHVIVRKKRRSAKPAQCSLIDTFQRVR